MTYTINDILASQFSGRVERMAADIPGDATEQQIADHLANNVEGPSVPTAAEVLAAIPAYQALLNKKAVPESVSPRQIRMALTRVNLRQSVEAAVAAGDQDLKDWWEFSQVFERNHPQVEVMVTTLGVTSEQADNLWQLAATI